MSQLLSRLYKPNPEACCEACVFGRGEHTEWCVSESVKAVRAMIPEGMTPAEFAQAYNQEPEDETYSNIRQILGSFIGKRLVDITQHDADEFAETQQSYVMLMFEDGGYIKFPVGDEGFDHDGAA